MHATLIKQQMRRKIKAMKDKKRKNKQTNGYLNNKQNLTVFLNLK